MLPEKHSRICGLQNMRKRGGKYISISLITYWLQCSYLQLVVGSLCKFCDLRASSWSYFLCNPPRSKCVSCWDLQTGYDITQTGRPAQCSHSHTHTDASTRTSVEVLFSTKVQLYQIWIYFYSEVQHIPSASDYIKTYNVHTVDISTLPFTVSGLNRHYFSFLQQIIKLKKGQRERKWQNVCIWWQRIWILWVFCDRQKSRPQTRW